MSASKKSFTSISPLFLVLSSFFITSLLISNIIAGKIATFFGIALPAAVILFPVTYIFGDVLTEVYGFKRARLIIWTGFGANLLMAFVFLIVLALPYPDFWNGQEAFQTVLGMTPRLVAASLIAYLAGEFANSVVLSRLKVKTKGSYLWIRTIGSTLVGEGIDTILFISIAFTGIIPLEALGNMMIAQYIWKVTYEIIITPLTYLLVRFVKQKEQLDVFDTEEKYNPFTLEV